MDLPVPPPVKPMLARAAARIPPGMLYEPKWDGFRALVFRDGPELEITSRNTRPMTRYFPELVEVLLAGLPPRCVLDGEIVVVGPDGLDFAELGQRVHPAVSRVDRLARETPVSFVAFDLLALGDEALVDVPFARRRAALEEVLAGRAGPSKPFRAADAAGSGTLPAAGSAEPRRVPSGLYLTPSTGDQAVAQKWFDSFEGAGLDGLVAKPPDGPYEPDRRTMVKIKHERTADCVIAGYRPHKNDPEAVGSLLLGLYGERDRTGDAPLLSVGVSSAFPMARRRELVREFADLVMPIASHPWARPGAQDGVVEAGGVEAGSARPAVSTATDAASATRTPWDAGESRWSRGRDLSFVPLRPERVVEVRYDHMEGPRFRHTAQFVRFRPDRDPASCTYAQLERPVTFDITEVLGIVPA